MMRLSDAIHVSELSQMDRLTVKKKKHNRTWRVWNSSDKTSSCLLLGSKWASASLHSLTCSCVSTGGRGSASKSNAAPVTGASDYARRIDLLPQSVEQASTKTSQSCSRFQIEQSFRLQQLGARRRRIQWSETRVGRYGQGRAILIGHRSILHKRAEATWRIGKQIDTTGPASSGNQRQPAAGDRRGLSLTG
jgi:hypothetical protein